MSEQLINHSPDLKKLRDEGYNIEIRSNYLLVKDIPYVNTKREIKRGILVSELTTAGESTTVPRDHVVDFAGDTPCDASGMPLNKIIIQNQPMQLTKDLVAQYKFSSKPIPSGRYQDYHEKMIAYIAILTGYAHSINPDMIAQTFPVITAGEEESVFKYLDTASSRAGISLVNKKLEQSKIAIVGVGGTGSYIFDLTAKTPVKEIHLFDRDTFLTHNAFRAPGAASVDELNNKPNKVEYLKNIYLKMRRGIIDHNYNIDSSNVTELKGMDFVFLCIDANDIKKLIVENLENFGIPFIDTGLDVGIIDDSLNGIIRVTASEPGKREHFRRRVSLAGTNADKEYEQNIQIADLNALNAALAVIKWKKICGFYLDFQKEYHITYTIDCNTLISDEFYETSENKA